MPSADRANVVYRDLHGSYFEVLFVFVVGLEFPYTARNVLLVFRKTFLHYLFNGTLSKNGSRNCFSTGQAVDLAHYLLILYTVV